MEVKNVICQMCFESEAMENSTLCKECSDSMNDKGFEIKCLNCGSTECFIQDTGDYDYEETYIPSGMHEIVCRNCGQVE